MKKALVRTPCQDRPLDLNRIGGISFAFPELMRSANDLSKTQKEPYITVDHLIQCLAQDPIIQRCLADANVPNTKLIDNAVRAIRDTERMVGKTAAAEENKTPNLSCDAYSVGIICALAKEKTAVKAMLDEVCPRLPPTSGDENDYTFSKIGEHGVAIACLPGDIETTSASIVAVNMMRSFPIKIGLMVGICGGVWSDDRDVRLGDVVVSNPAGLHGGVVQWDFGKVEGGKGVCRKGTLNKPPRPLRNAVAGLESRSGVVPSIYR